METDTCRQCLETKETNLFVKKPKHTCKLCYTKNKCKQAKVREQKILNSEETKTCYVCSSEKSHSNFVRYKNICNDCNNARRREKRINNVEYRDRCREESRRAKQKATLRRKKEREELLGVGNKLCKYCNEIKSKERFRHNRCKCRDCERDDPKEKFKRYVRTRIYNCLLKRKNKSSIDYLGCTSKEYMNWIMTYNEEYTLENYGNVWHIDHVIPISKFDLDKPDIQMIAFNWRNTMPLDKTENLRKNNRIVSKQVTEHYLKLQQYHTQQNTKIPKEFVELFATHLDAGIPLEPPTTTHDAERQ